MSLLRALRTHAGASSARAFVLLLAMTLTESVGLLLLVPLLELVGVTASGGTAGALAAAVRGAFAALGIVPTLASVLGVYVGLVALRAVLEWAETSASAAAERDLVVGLRVRLHDALLHAAWPWIARRRASDLTHALTAECDRVGQASSQLLHLAADLLVGSVYLALALALSPVTTLAALLGGGLLLLGSRRLVSASRLAGDALTDHSQSLYALAGDHVAGAKAIRAYGAERLSAERFDDASRAVGAVHVSMLRGYAGTRAWMTLGGALVLAATVLLARGAAGMSAGGTLLLLFALARLVPRLSRAQELWQHLVAALPALETVERLTEDAARAREEARAREAEPAPVPARLPASPTVRLEEVSVSYPGAERPAMRSVGCEIPARRTTAVVGASGAGKSTLADAVLGLVRPSSGRVLLDDVTLDAQALSAWRARVGYVPQDGFLFHDTVAVNLRWARPDASDAELVEALRLAAAEEFVLALPAGLHTVVGDRGVLLSGGERQRLALARALLRRPDLLVLDEATSALDGENERRIQDAIAALHGRMTILVITHRLTTVRDADLIHVMDQGRIVESGTWDELLAGPHGRLRALCAAQGLLAPDSSPVPA